MATKNRPGRFDCYESAEPDEPIFTLRANDPLASYIVDIWTAVSAGEYVKALGHFFGMMLNFGGRYERFPRDEDKLAEARKCGDDMRDWYCRRRPQTEAQPADEPQ